MIKSYNNIAKYKKLYIICPIGIFVFMCLYMYYIYFVCIYIIYIEYICILYKICTVNNIHHLFAPIQNKLINTGYNTISLKHKYVLK